MITFRAIGGLGNQLFVLAAAIAHSDWFGYPVSIDLRRAARGIERGGPHIRGSSLLSFDLNETPLERYLASPLKGFLLDHLGSLESKIARIIPSPSQSSWCHTSKAAGYDPAVFENDSIKYFRGYFQSYRYLEYLHRVERRFDLRLANPSLTYLSKREKVGGEPFTVVHIRRGDYAKAATNFGLLDTNYYSKALKRLSNEVASNKVLLFSDDPLIYREQEVSALLKSCDGEFVETSGLDPAEVVLLMSAGSSFVIANSSFSWWAAALSKSQSVIYPETWFRAAPQPLDLNFPFWTPVESSWLD